jgi:hypothetical protein
MSSLQKNKHATTDEMDKTQAAQTSAGMADSQELSATIASSNA